MEQKVFVYGLHKETVAAIMMLYKNTKVNVRSHEDYADDIALIANAPAPPESQLLCLEREAGTINFPSKRREDRIHVP